MAGAIPTREKLCSKLISTNPTCQRCGIYDETINHLLFDCHHAQAIWKSAGFTDFDSANNVLEDNIRRIFQIKDTQTLREEDRLLPFWVSWMIWKSRTEFVFTQRNVHADEDAMKSQAAVAEWILANPYTLKDRSIHSSHRSSAWEPPPSGWLKCNYDCSFRVDYGYIYGSGMDNP